MKIAVLICYYGKLPWYFRFFLKSCAANPSVDFFIITDSGYAGQLPSNVLLVNRSLSEIRSTASRQFSFDIALQDPYKLCDLKPAYGVLFADLIEGYDFWAHGDIDVIYGNIRSAITDQMLQTYDVISVRGEYISGFFVLYRNSEYVNHLFRESKDFALVFTEPEHFCFDECNFNHNQLAHGRSVFDVPAEIECMTRVVKQEVRRRNIRAYFRTMAMEGVPGMLEWNNGELTYAGEKKVVLYHLIDFKKQFYKIIPSWQVIPNRFYIHRYHITRFPPHSPRGKWELFLVCKWKQARLQLATAAQYFSWLGKYCTSSARIKSSLAEQYTRLCGNYSMKEFIINCQVENGRMTVKLGDHKPVPLRHKKDLRFVAGRFNILSDVNIDIEFHFDKRRNKPTMHVLASGSPPIMLIKEN